MPGNLSAKNRNVGPLVIVRPINQPLQQLKTKQKQNKHRDANFWQAIYNKKKKLKNKLKPTAIIFSENYAAENKQNKRYVKTKKNNNKTTN